MPCSVPSTEHGNYLAMSSNPLGENEKPNTKLLTAFEEIQNGDIVDFQCDTGYNVKGKNQLKCFQGKWDVDILPECLPAPCILPSIN